MNLPNTAKGQREADAIAESMATVVQLTRCCTLVVLTAWGNLIMTTYYSLHSSPTRRLLMMSDGKALTDLHYDGGQIRA